MFQVNPAKPKAYNITLPKLLSDDWTECQLWDLWPFDHTQLYICLNGSLILLISFCGISLQHHIF